MDNNKDPSYLFNLTLIRLVAIYLVTLVAALFRTPTLDAEQVDEDAEEAEEEGLLASTGRRFEAAREDITGRIDR
jgi:LMBR1 domain-containing protein 1